MSRRFIWGALASIIRGAIAPVVVLFGLVAGQVFGQSVTLASAELGATGRISGSSVTVAQFVGWRFETTAPLAVESVGGHLLSFPDQPGDIFAALVRLPSIASLPLGAPFTDDELIATTTFRPNFPSSEITTPLAATLSPGSYMLVFGTGLFGATSEAALPNFDDQPDIPPTNLSSFIFWSRPFTGLPFEWRQNLASHMRFVINAEVIDLPGDYNQDGEVDAQDYDVWRADFGSTAVLAADGNGNQIVDAADYTIWRDHLSSSGTGAAVPEPAAASLLTVGAAWAIVGGVKRSPRVANNDRV